MAAEQTTVLALGRAGTSRFVQQWLPVLISAALILVALIFGILTTRGLSWPDLTDQSLGEGPGLYRDMASARTMLEGEYGPDPIYLGERTWYNPVVPALIAGVTFVTGQPLHVVTTRIGTYANLLAPLCFFWMAAVLFGRWTALFSLAAFLFLLPGSLPAWLSATYSPWLMPVNFVQSFFYLLVIAWYRAQRKGSARAYVLPGILWGITFLGHTAPALVFGGMTLLWMADVAWSVQRGFTWRISRASVVRWSIMVVAALVVSAPFLAVIAGHYGLRIRNPVPSANSVSLLSRDLPELIWLHLTVPMAIAMFGLWIVVTRSFRPVSRRLLLGWIAVTGVFLVYSFLRLGAKLGGVILPNIVPSFHFFFYLKAATAVLFGVGVTWLGRMAAIAIARRRGSEATGSMRPLLVSALVCAVLLAFQARTYAARDNFQAARRGAITTAGSDQIHVLEWLLSHHGPSDVALASDDDATFVCAPSGVRAVMAWPVWSNPYIDLQPRAQARDAMFNALDGDDSAAFRELAQRYGVTFVITESPRSARYDAKTPSDLELVLSAGSRRVYRVRQAGS